MRLLTSAFIVGLVMLYFVNMALFKTPILDLEWTIHAGIRFVAGFFILGISCFYAHAFSLKHAIQLILLIVAADYVYDYFMGEFVLKLEVILHGMYMLIWGGLMGYLAARTRRTSAS